MTETLSDNHDSGDEIEKLDDDEKRDLEEMKWKLDKIKYGGDSVSIIDAGTPVEVVNHAYHHTTIIGFISFLIATKSVTLIIYVVLLIIAGILLDNAFFFTVMAFGIAEVILIALTIFHVIRPTLGVVLCIIGSESVLGLTKAVFAITMELLDGGKDCGKESCSMLMITENERFGLFWFCLITAFYDFFIALIIISHSPQMQEFEMGDEYLF